MNTLRSFTSKPEMRVTAVLLAATAAISACGSTYGDKLSNEGSYRSHNIPVAAKHFDPPQHFRNDPFVTYNPATGTGNACYELDQPINVEATNAVVSAAGPDGQWIGYANNSPALPPAVREACSGDSDGTIWIVNPNELEKAASN